MSSRDYRHPGDNQKRPLDTKGHRRQHQRQTKRAQKLCQSPLNSILRTCPSHPHTSAHARSSRRSAALGNSPHVSGMVFPLYFHGRGGRGGRGCGLIFVPSMHLFFSRTCLLHRLVWYFASFYFFFRLSEIAVLSVSLFSLS